ncbi:alpha/beta-hydrolase [Mycena crocata]|nr:alpha/beta-hydrolase [Mycena crocata]
MASSSFLKLAVAGVFLSNLGASVAADDFDWETLKATDSLQWTACYSGFECSLLQVPLDYSATDKGNASIAVVRLPSTVPKEGYLGPILFNPGGPGGSGVSAIVSVGASFAEFLGPQFDIVGFDPRGVAFSKPTVSFFKTAVERQLWTPPDLNLRYPSLNASSEVISNQWAQFQLVGQLAKERDTDEYLQHITTDNVARDMLRITEAFGFEKLQYWGVSYGTVLGATFATTFPVVSTHPLTGCISRFMDSEAWYSANVTGSMTDTDKALQTFFDGCAAAGPDACAFHAPTASQIADKLTALTESIRAQPFPVLTALSHGIGLAALAAGNATGVYTEHESPAFECDCDAGQAPFTLNNFEAQIVTSCGDAAAIEDSVADLRQFYAQEARVSSFADIWGHWRIHCSGWKVHREGRFLGKSSRDFQLVPLARNTSFPLLVIGNTADPVTPLAWAKKASALFPGSVLLTQDSPGHMSLAAPSLCTHGHLQAYFRNGTLPQLFPRAATNTTVPLDAVRAIGDVVRPMAAGGLRSIF